MRIRAHLRGRSALTNEVLGGSRRACEPGRERGFARRDIATDDADYLPSIRSSKCVLDRVADVVLFLGRRDKERSEREVFLDLLDLIVVRPATRPLVLPVTAELGRHRGAYGGGIDAREKDKCASATNACAECDISPIVNPGANSPGAAPNLGRRGEVSGYGTS